MKIAIVNKQTLSIESWYDADQPNQAMYGGPWGNAELTKHISLPENLHHLEVVAVEQDGDIVLEVSQERVEAHRAMKLEELRAKRNSLLLETDKYMLSDYPISSENRDLMVAYRQALRDLPEQVSDPRDEIQWPVKPQV